MTLWSDAHIRAAHGPFKEAIRKVDCMTADAHALKVVLERANAELKRLIAEVEQIAGAAEIDEVN